MIYGNISVDNNLPYVHVGLVVDKTTVHPEFVLDTGFSGDLKIDTETAADLGINVTLSGSRFTNVNGLFSVFGYRIVVDCKNKTAYLERVS